MSDQEVKNALVEKREKIITNVVTKVGYLQDSHEINFPECYSPQNAMKAAWMEIQDTKDKNGHFALAVCTQGSIERALYHMIIQGLTPAKNQVYFIVRGNKLYCQRSYFGTVAVTKRIERVSDVFAQVVYKDDTFNYIINRGSKKITEHTQSINNIKNNEIIAAYCTILYDKDQEHSDVMTKEQIDLAWNRRSTIKLSSAHTDQPEEMSKRTVINRTCKIFMNTSDDSDVLVEAFNNTTGFEGTEGVDEEIESEGNIVEAEQVGKPDKKPDKKQDKKPDKKPVPTARSSSSKKPSPVTKKDLEPEEPSQGNEDPGPEEPTLLKKNTNGRTF